MINFYNASRQKFTRWRRTTRCSGRWYDSCQWGREEQYVFSFCLPIYGLLFNGVIILPANVFFWLIEYHVVLLSIISQLRPGADLSRITFPTFILEPRSMLERITKYEATIFMKYITHEKYGDFYGWLFPYRCCYLFFVDAASCSIQRPCYRWQQ